MHVRRALGALTAATVLATGLTLSAAGTASADPAGLSLVQTRTSLLATHETYEQTYRGLPVLGGFLQRHVSADGSVQTVDGRISVGSGLDVAATVASTDALRTALARVGGASVRQRLAILPGPTARLVWSVQTATDEVLVDARTGVVVRSQSLVKEATGRGQVFDPNPVVFLQNENLKDQNDADAAVPATAYRSVNLLNLDGSGYLRGTYARIATAAGGLARSTDGTYNFTRNDDRFEQVNAYYGVDRAQLYFRSLGFTDVNAEQQDINVNTIPDDNSYYSPSADAITFGTGGVDDAEDLEVVWHELGHAVQDDQVPGYGSSTEAGSIGEGFGDYLALTMSSLRADDTTVAPLACIMDWDATSYTSTVPHCLRRADTDKHYPEDKVGEVHADGEIWSAALYDIWQAIGRRRTDTSILEGQFSFRPNTSMPQAAANIVTAARGLYGPTVADAVQAAFVARGILA